MSALETSSGLQLEGLRWITRAFQVDFLVFAGGLKLLAQNLLNRSRTHLEVRIMRGKHGVLMMGCVSEDSEGPPRAEGMNLCGQMSV